MRNPPGPSTPASRRAMLAEMFGHKFGRAVDDEAHEQHLAEHELARWYNYQNDDIAGPRDTFTDTHE